jgi:tripartite-type tricarboxylate transporter receptor subunit TctC
MPIRRLAPAQALRRIADSFSSCHTMRRHFLRALPALALAMTSLAAQAQPYPSQPVRIVVPYSPGGSSDVLARAIGDELGKALGQAVIVDNRPGAGSMLGTQFVAGEKADGHTLLLADVPFAIVPALYRERARYNVERDFAPVALLGVSPAYLFVNADAPQRSAAEFVQAAKAAPATISIGSGGNGSLTHMMAELFMGSTGAQLVHVPYKGAGAAITDLAAGQIQSGFTTMASASGLYRAGKLRALAVTSPERQKDTPDVPTFAERGIANMTVQSWWGLVVPAGTSAEVRQRLSDAMRQVMQVPAVRARFATAGVDVPADTGAAALQKYVQEDLARWREVVQRADIRIQ